ncbi:MAG: lytic transglycosylase F [Marinilabiliales bacterium]|nr:MAG: lytic transglycosylase F [Marinilabiliales bacterium]
MNKFKLVILLTALLSSCNFSKDINNNRNSSSNKAGQNKNYLTTENDLAKVLENKKLVAVTDYGPTSYFVYHGEPMGYQYDFLKRFTEYLGVELDLRLEENLLTSIEMLENGEIDLIAMGLTVTNKRKKYFEFTDPILYTRQVLVQRKPEGFEKMRTLDEIESHLIRNTLFLAGKTIYVKQGTIYKNQLSAIANNIGDSINIIEDERWTDKLIDAVSDGEIDYTIADEHIALVNAREHRNIDVKTPVSFPQKVSWAAQKGQTELVDTINYWLSNYKKKLEFRLLYNKYFLNKRSTRIAKSTYNSYSGGMLSPYDEYLKKYSSIVGWDWRLIASLMYQESEFKINAKSWVGAYGLMQLMPSVMEIYGLDTTANAEQQIKAGIKHIKYQLSLVPEEVSDSIQRIKFALAGYNSGMGHILDARRLAEKYGKNPNMWDDNVDDFVLKLSNSKYYHDPVVEYGYMRGEETYNLVSEVIDRYNQYKKLIKN